MKATVCSPTKADARFPGLGKNPTPQALSGGSGASRPPWLHTDPAEPQLMLGGKNGVREWGPARHATPVEWSGGSCPSVRGPSSRPRDGRGPPCLSPPGRDGWCKGDSLPRGLRCREPFPVRARCLSCPRDVVPRPADPLHPLEPPQPSPGSPGAAYRAQLQR